MESPRTAAYACPRLSQGPSTGIHVSPSSDVYVVSVTTPLAPEPPKTQSCERDAPVFGSLPRAAPQNAATFRGDHAAFAVCRVQLQPVFHELQTSFNRPPPSPRPPRSHCLESLGLQDRKPCCMRGGGHGYRFGSTGFGINRQSISPRSNPPLYQ